MLLVAASVPAPVRCHSTVGPLPLSAPTEVTIATALLPRAKGVVICGAAWNRSSSWVAVSELSRVARSASAVAACWSLRFSKGVGPYPSVTPPALYRDRLSGHHPGGTMADRSAAARLRRALSSSRTAAARLAADRRG